MTNRGPKHILRTAVICGAFWLASCTGSVTELDSAAHDRLLSEDRAAASGAADRQSDETIELSLQRALELGLERNLDARVSALEELAQHNNVTLAQLRALPGVEFSYGYTGRSNPGASSSRSVVMGNQSLEPSQSAEKHRRVAALTAEWNLLDAALALNEAARTDYDAAASAERHAKVMQNVERDVYAAYWRALAWQDVRDQGDDLYDRAGTQVENIETALSEGLISPEEASERISAINERSRTLQDLRDRARMSEIELKSLLSLPLDSRLILTTKRPDIAADVARITTGDIEAQEWAALKSRPEMREEIMKKNMTIEDSRREVIQTLPGLGLFFSREYDSNKFLVESDWASWSSKIVQSVTSIITMPSRIAAAQTQQDVADARRQALSAAIMAQTRIARTRLESMSGNYRTASVAARAALRKAIAATGKRENGYASGLTAVQAQMEDRIETLRTGLAYAELQDAYAAFNNTIGRGLSANIVVAHDTTGATQ